MEIQKQDVDRKKSNRRILEDLNRIRSKAEEVWSKIGKEPGYKLQIATSP